MSIDDVLAAPIAESLVLLVSGTGLSREPSRSATLLSLELAKAAGVCTMIDLDLRSDQWEDPRTFGVTVRSVLPLLDVVIGTEDEVRAVTLKDAAQMTVSHGQVSSAEIAGDLDAAVARVLASGVGVLVVKRGRRGATVFEAGQPPVDAAGFPVEIYNTLGAGDAFAGGLVYGYAQGWDWGRAARFGNAVGAIVVTRHACANDMPTLDEVKAFVQAQGGL
jgi:5-dehydro-2-deoxygluconokinase